MTESPVNSSMSTRAPLFSSAPPRARDLLDALLADAAANLADAARGDGHHHLRRAADELRPADRTGRLLREEEAREECDGPAEDEPAGEAEQRARHHAQPRADADGAEPAEGREEDRD